MDVEELSKLVKAKPDEIQNTLEELKRDLDEKESSTMLVNEGSSWKLTVREQFLSLVQKIVTETELSKTIMETLAVIAFKYPIKQSDLIKIRTNKAYDHLKELEEMGYITRQKHGRTNLIKLTQKFFEYFDLPKEKLKEKFQDFGSIAKAIEEKEKDIETTKAEQKKRAEEEKEQDEKIKEGIEILDDETETYGDKGESEVEEDKEKLGDLEIVNEPSEEELEKERERLEELKEKNEDNLGENEKPENTKFEGEGIKMNAEKEKIVDEKVERILHPPKEDEDTELAEGQEDNSNDDGEKNNQDAQEEPKDLLEASMDNQEEDKEEKK